MRQSQAYRAYFLLYSRRRAAANAGAFGETVGLNNFGVDIVGKLSIECGRKGRRSTVNGNLKLTPFTLKQQSKIDPFDDLLRLNLWLNSYSLFIF